MSSVADLEKLAALRTSGALTDVEFETAKKRILGSVETRKSDTPSNWMKPWGAYLFLLSIAGLALIGYSKSAKMSNEDILMDLAFNPLFFVGLPLAFYWLYKSDFFEQLAGEQN